MMTLAALDERPYFCAKNSIKYGRPSDFAPSILCPFDMLLFSTMSKMADAILPGETTVKPAPGHGGIRDPPGLQMNGNAG